MGLGDSILLSSEDVRDMGAWKGAADEDGRLVGAWLRVLVQGAAMGCCCCCRMPRLTSRMIDWLWSGPVSWRHFCSSRFLASLCSCS